MNRFDLDVPRGPHCTRRTVLAGMLGTALLALVACESSSRPEFENTDVTGADFARDFHLTGHDGKAYSLADFRGKAVVVFFGYTQCPDVCPTTMSELAEAMRLLGADADRVQVLFVTVDPERDTPELLASYVPAFDPRFLGLYGDLEATERTAKAFRVFYQKVPGKTPGSYSVDHTAGCFVYDARGRLRLFTRHGVGPEPLAHDLRILLKENG